MAHSLGFALQSVIVLVVIQYFMTVVDTQSTIPVPPNGGSTRVPPIHTSHKPGNVTKHLPPVGGKMPQPPQHGVNMTGKTQMPQQLPILKTQ